MTAPSISEERLQRLRPGDIQTIADHLADDYFGRDLLVTFRSLMSGLKEPFASELDDVTRIALQLKMAGIWDIVSPTAFAETLAPAVKDAVIRQFLEALGVDRAREARSLDEPRARSRLKGLVLDAKKNETAVDAM